MAKTNKEMIEVMGWFDNGGEIECVERGNNNWEIVSSPRWNWDDFEYRIKEFQYPMWFKAKSTGLIIKFNDLKSGIVVEKGTTYYYKGEYTDEWIPHTDKDHWVEIEEPRPKQKITIEKWLIEENNIQFVVETSDIDSWLKSFPTAKKLKLIESYEVEI